MPIRRDLRHFYKGEAWQAIRKRIRERAGDKCEQCGKPNGIWRIQCGVAHLDHNPANNSDDNLKWLCRKCHLLWDKTHHADTRKERKDQARPLLKEAV